MSTRDVLIYATGCLSGAATAVVALLARFHVGQHAAPLRRRPAKPDTPPEPARGVAPADPRPAALQPVAVPAPPRSVNGGPR